MLNQSGTTGLSIGATIIAFILASAQRLPASEEFLPIDHFSIEKVTSKNVLRPLFNESTLNTNIRASFKPGLETHLGIKVVGIGTVQKPLQIYNCTLKQFHKLLRPYIEDGSAINFISESGEESPLFFKQNGYLLSLEQYKCFLDSYDGAYLPFVMNDGITEWNLSSQAFIKKDNIIIDRKAYEELVGQDLWYTEIDGERYYNRNGFILTKSENEIANIWETKFNENGIHSDDEQENAKRKLIELGVWGK